MISTKEVVGFSLLFALSPFYGWFCVRVMRWLDHKFPEAR